jgi:hypothetical protein
MGFILFLVIIYILFRVATAGKMVKPNSGVLNEGTCKLHTWEYKKINEDTERLKCTKCGAHPGEV